MLPFIFYCSWFLKITFRKFYILIIKEGCYRTPLFDTPLPPPHPLKGVKLSKTIIANRQPAKYSSSMSSLLTTPAMSSKQVPASRVFNFLCLERSSAKERRSLGSLKHCQKANFPVTIKHYNLIKSKN